MKFGSKKTTGNNTSVSTGQVYPNRAEEVRSRRAQRSKERISSVSSRVVSPPPSRPVTVRGSAFGRPIHKQATGRPRRQFYVTMDRAAGTELRLPAIPMLNPGWRLASGFLAILMIVGIYSLWNSPFCQINTVEVQGVQRLTSDDINAALNLENLAIIEVDPAQVKEKLISTYPELINIHVKVEMPNAVAISAEERVPVLAILKGDQTEWVDETGYIFPARGEAQPLVAIHAEDGLPLIPAVLLGAETPASQQALSSAASGTVSAASSQEEEAASVLPVPQIVDPTTLTALLELSKVLPPETQLAYSKEHGLGWKSPEGWQIFIGTDLHQIEDKYGMYQHLTRYLADQGINPALVSVEHLNAPYYRLEQ